MSEATLIVISMDDGDKSYTCSGCDFIFISASLDIDFCKYCQHCGAKFTGVRDE